MSSIKEENTLFCFQNNVFSCSWIPVNLLEERPKPPPDYQHPNKEMVLPAMSRSSHFN